MPDEIDDLSRCEEAAQRGLDAYVEVADALAEIRDRHLYRASHPTFEAYLRDRWGLGPADDPQRPLTPAVSTPCEALARACEETLSALGADERMVVEIRLTTFKHDDPGVLEDRLPLVPGELASVVDPELAATLRWLLTQASGTIADVAHQLEIRAADIDAEVRAQLRDDVLVLDDELAALKAAIGGAIDWNAEFERLLGGEIPPPASDGYPEDE